MLDMANSRTPMPTTEAATTREGIDKELVKTIITTRGRCQAISKMAARIQTSDLEVGNSNQVEVTITNT